MICTLVVTLDGKPLLDHSVRPFERTFEVPDTALRSEVLAEAQRVFDRAIKWDVREA